MELAYYSDYAVRLVNTEEPTRGKDSLTSVGGAGIRDLLGGNSSAARRATDAGRHPLPGRSAPGCAPSSRRPTAATRPCPWTC